MNMKKFKYILVFLFFVFLFGIFLNSNSKNNYKKIGSSKYSTAQIEGFEKSLFGSTGWALVDLPLKESASNNSNTVTTVSKGQPFMILGESGDYWEIKYGDYHGYIEHAYCMINLPDVVPSIKYNIANASASMYKSSGYDITSESIVGDDSRPEYNITGTKLYSAGKISNDRIGRDEYIVPSLYSTAKKIAKAEVLSLQNNKRLMIYDSYRPVSVSRKVSTAFGALADTNETVASGISGWDRTWFIATITPGVNMSAHNVGAAIDVSLWDNISNSEVTDMPTAMHELSTSATRCTNSSCNQLSSNMSNSTSAMLLSNIMTDSNVGMGTLASEWWHFQDNDGLNRMKNKTNITGRDFQVTEIVSNFGFTGNLTTRGDVNGDGFINGADAELIYNFYSFLKTNTCETCSDLVTYSDLNQSGDVDLDDVFLAFNVEEDFMNTSYTIGDNYIYLGSNSDYSSIVDLKNYANIEHEIVNNKYIIKYNNEVIKEYDIVYIYLPGADDELDYDYILKSNISSIGCVNCSVEDAIDKVYIKYNDVTLRTYDVVDYSYPNHDLSKLYLFSGNGPTGIHSDILTNIFYCDGCFINFDQKNDKIYIKKNDNVIREYDIVYYLSDDYDLSGDSLSISGMSVSDFLNDVSCINCVFEVYDGDNKVTSGTIPSNGTVVVKETVSGNDDELKSFSISSASISVTGVQLNESNLSLNIGDQEKLIATVSPDSATNKNVTWESSDTSVATVDNEGNVRALSVGEAIITVKTVDGNFTDTCLVTVSGATKYTVTFKDGNNTYTSEFEEGEDVVFKIDLQKAGYRLVGWKYNNQNYRLEDRLVMPGNDIELSAIWELIVPEINYELSDNIITNILIGTSVNNLNLGVDSIYQVKVSKYDGTVKTGGLLGTGDKIEIYLDDKLVSSYFVSIKGDINGDGGISISDASMIYKKLRESVTFTNIQTIASDLNNDSSISISDISMIYKYIKNHS